MKMSIKVSIIIPVYNVAPYVEVCINSVLQQDYDSLEIIIVDDRGTDNSMTLVEKLLKNSSQDIIILKHEYNKGLSAARNTGIRQATGDYVFFLDSDDFIEPYCISTLVEMLKKYMYVDMVYGSSQRSSNSYLPENIVDRTDLSEFYNDRTRIKRMMLNYTKFPLSVWNRLIKRSWLLKHNLFFKEGIIFEDLHWNFYAAKYITCIALCKKTTHYYRSNPNGIMHTQYEKMIESGYIILDDWIFNLDFHSFFQQLHSIFYLAHTTYVRKYGGENRQKCIRVFYPLICILEMFIKNIQKYWLNPKSNRR